MNRKKTTLLGSVVFYIHEKLRTKVKIIGGKTIIA